MGSDGSLSEALSQALKLKVVKAAAMLQEVTQAPMGMWPPPAEHRGDGRSVCAGSVGMLVTPGETWLSRDEEVDQDLGHK
jgi:hypothetical protein